MIRLVAILALALGAVPAHADDTPAPAKLAPAARALLAEVEASYRKPVHLAMTFEQTVTNAVSGQAMTATGTVWIEKPDKLRFDFVQPKKATPKPKATYLFDGKVMWLVDHQNLQFGQRSAANSELPALVTFFLGAGTLARDFTITLASPRTLELTPKQASASYAKLVLVVDDLKHVSQATLIDSSGNRQSMKFTSLTIDKPAPAGTFVFDRRQYAIYRELKQ